MNTESEPTTPPPAKSKKPLTLAQLGELNRKLAEELTETKALLKLSQDNLVTRNKELAEIQKVHAEESAQDRAIRAAAIPIVKITDRWFKHPEFKNGQFTGKLLEPVWPDDGIIVCNELTAGHFAALRKVCPRK